MLKAELGKEIVIKVNDDVGVLADLARAIAEKGIDIKATACWVEGKNGVLHLVTDDNLRAIDALRAHKVKADEEKVVIAELPHKPGMLKQLAGKLKDAHINIRHLYASAHSGDNNCLTVLSCSDNDRAVVEINK